MEGKITDKQYKESVYGDYWQITLKNVQVQDQRLEGKYLCQISASENMGLKIGQQVLLSGKYSPWEEPTNPGQFDSGKYYCSLGILGQFKKCKILKQSQSYSQFREKMWNFRRQLDSFFKQELGTEDGALISAMLLGDKSSLKEEDKSLYQRNGISHILAISGLHLMLLGMGVFKGLKNIFGNRNGAVFSIIIMSVYCIVTGSSISTIRATIMFALSLIAGLSGRSYDSLSALGVAGIVQLFINPYVINNSGFWLSFLAVIGVTYVAPRLQVIFEAKGKFSRSLCVSMASAIATLPVLLCNYGIYPWYSIFLNLMILPLMAILLFFAVVLAGIPVVEFFIKQALLMKIAEPINFIIGNENSSMVLRACKAFFTIIIKVILKYFEMCCQVFEHAPLQDGYIGAPGWVQIVIYGLLVVVAISGVIKCSSLTYKMTLLSAMMILSLRLNLNVELTVLDVGQGDGVVISNNNGNVYISDCGSSSVSKVGKYRLIPFLKYKGYGNIKGIFISHLDEDHMNGIVELLEMAPKERIKISYLFLPESVLAIKEDVETIKMLQKLARQNKTEIVYLKQGERIRDGAMEFLCLYPESDKEQIYGQGERNNQSMVLCMKYKDFSMLLTGDVEKEGEKDILEYVDQTSFDKLNGIDVLKVAHHGSSGSSGEEFLEAFRPAMSIISCGKNNSYGHPHEETIERLEKTKGRILSTVECGSITFKIKKGKIKVTTRLGYGENIN